MYGCTEPAVEPVSREVEAPPSLQAAGLDAPAIVNLDESEVDALHIETYQVEAREVAYQIEVPGEVMPSPEHFSFVSAPISGRIVSIAAHEGEAVQRGAPLLEIESLEFGDLAASYLQARASLTLSEVQVERTRRLVTENIAAQRVLDQDEAALQQAKAALAASLARLQAVGLSQSEVEGWMEEGPASYAVLQVRSPLTGFIDEHHIDLGQAVKAYDEILSIVDPGHVMIKGYAPPAEAGAISVGDEVLVRNRQAGDRQVQARIASINPSLDAGNKSVVLNVLMPTEKGWPRPGDLVDLIVQHQNTVPEIVLPLSAVQYENNRATVFVKRAPGSYEKRYVEVGRVDQYEVVIDSGVTPGEEIAVTQVFNLKAISRFEQYGEE
jgi:cobalt-zinc-cadmium efflux system membrane fusion protein